MTSELRKAETPDHIDIYENRDPYREWLESEGIKVIKEYVFDDLNTVELGPWERKGGSGAIINIPNAMLPNDTHLVEIKPGGKSEPEHHLYEEMVTSSPGAAPPASGWTRPVRRRSSGTPGASSPSRSTPGTSTSTQAVRTRSAMPPSRAHLR